MVKLKTWTRPKDRDLGQREVTAAAASVDLRQPRDRDYLGAVMSDSRSIARRCWRHYERLGEVHYAVERSARVAGYSEFLIQRRNDEGIWEQVKDGPLADVPATLYSPFGGTRGLVERFFALMKVPADSVLIRVTDEDDGEPDGYQFLSADEIDDADGDIGTLARRDRTEGIRWIQLPSGRGGRERLVREVKAVDVLGRIWHPSHQYVQRPNSALIPLDTECEVLDILTKTLKAKLKSRFALAGLFYLPSEIGEAQVSGMTNRAGTTDVLDYVMRAMTANIDNWDNAEAMTAIMLRGPGDAGQNIQHILFDRSVDETDIRLRAELIERILFGLDVQQSATQNSQFENRWGDWNASDEERRISVEPDLEMLDWSLSRLVLNPTMLELEYTPEEIARHRIWHDLDRSSIKSNAQDDARQAHDRGVANQLAVARRTGLEEDEVLEGDEYIRWVGVKTNEPYLALYGLPEAKGVDWDKVSKSKPGPPAQKPGQNARAGPGVANPGAPGERPPSRRS
jgi:hypothetical protein